MAHELERRTPSDRPHQSAHVLPAEVSTFIGREREITTVRQLLEATRLLTLEPDESAKRAWPWMLPGNSSS